MNIPLKTWMKYKDKLAAIDRRAEVEMISFVQSIGGYGDHVNECLDYAFALATKYGEAAGAAACELYEAVAAASGITLEAMPAATATYEEVAKTLNGIHKMSSDPAKLSQGVSRLVKTTAADTTLQNAVRDGAYFAWVPNGDTCPYCLMLASYGWRKAGKKTLKGDHAEHIHANCDCQYAVTFDPLSGVEGYDPAEYEAMFDGIDGDWNKKVNALRCQQYAKNKDSVNAQAKDAYSRRQIRKTIKDLEKESDRWVKELSKQEQNSITKYAYNPGDKSPNRFFERMNAMLRGDATEEANMLKHADNISSGISKFNIEKSFYVYRRVDHDPTKGVEVGDVFTIKQFLSTSVDPEKALKKEYLIKIRVKKGTSAAYIDSLSEFDQTELLIDKNVTYKVKSKSDKETVWEVIL